MTSVKMTLKIRRSLSGLIRSERPISIPVI